MTKFHKKKLLFQKHQIQNSIQKQRSTTQKTNKLTLEKKMLWRIGQPSKESRVSKLNQGQVDQV